MVFTNFCLFFYKTHQVKVLDGAGAGRRPCPWRWQTAAPVPGTGEHGLPAPPPAPTGHSVPTGRVGWAVVAGGGGRRTTELRATLQDDYPLASLPLLGYSVSVPKEADCVHKEHVFKLQFKSHVYFFRAESKYTFER